MKTENKTIKIELPPLESDQVDNQCHHRDIGNHDGFGNLVTGDLVVLDVRLLLQPFVFYFFHDPSVNPLTVRLRIYLIIEGEGVVGERVDEEVDHIEEQKQRDRRNELSTFALQEFDGHAPRKPDHVPDAEEEAVVKEEYITKKFSKQPS